MCQGSGPGSKVHSAVPSNETRSVGGAAEHGCMGCGVHMGPSCFDPQLVGHANAAYWQAGGH